jgi:protocatechuate 3,4-dioxygenase beta subunit
MKPMHLAVVCAVIAVAAVLFMMLSESGDRRHRDRGVADRAAGRTTSGEQEGTGDADAGERAPGAGAYSVQLEIVLPDGSPAAGAEMELSGRALRRDVATTEGKVEIGGLLPGFYNLIARHGKAVGALDFRLEETTDLGTLELREAISIRGHVFDPHGKALAGARVEALSMVAPGRANLATVFKSIMTPEQIAARTAAGADGAYELLVPTGGTYAVRASAKGFAQEAEAARPYTADVDGLDFYLFPGAQVAGQVVETSGAPIAGALVLLIEPLSAFSGGIPKVEGITAADGTFSVAAMPSGNLLLVVRAIGYATHMESNLSLPALGLTITLEAGISLRLRTVDAEQPARPAPGVSVALMYRGSFGGGETDDRGELLVTNLPTKSSRMWGGQQQALLWGGGYVARMAEIGTKEPVDGVLDMGDVEMTKGGVVFGKVLDRTTGDPIAGAQLRSLGGMDQQLEFMGAVTAVSADDGRYELEGVPLKAHTILASHPDYLSTLDDAALIQVVQGGGGKQVFPDGRKKVEHDLELVPAMTATGVVLAPDGNPVAGAKVGVRDQMSIFRRILGSNVPSAVTDAEGRFTLGGLRKGQAVQVFATHRDYGNSEGKAARAGEPLTLTLTEPLLLRGRVVDERDAAVAGVRVTVERAAQQPSSGIRVGPNAGESGATRPAVTDEEGRYLLRNAPPGKLTVTFDHSGYELIEKPIDVAAGTGEKDLGKTVLRRGLGLEGRMVDEEGEPVAGVQIHANWHYGGGQRPAPGAPGRLSGSDTTDEQGGFAIYGLKAGKYELRTWQPGLYASKPIVQTGTKDISVVLMKAGQLTGRVMSLGAPVAGANVTARIGTPGSNGQTHWTHVGWARTDSDGVFRLDSLPPDRAFSLRITHDGYRPKEVEGVRASDRRDVFELDRGVQIGGKVVTPDGEPVAGVNLTIQVNGRHSKNVASGLDGSFEAGGLDEGTITVRAARWNQDYVAEPLTVAPGDRSVRYVVRMGESIRGRILDADGTPANQVHVEALDGNGRQVGQAWVWQGEGAFQLRGLPKGTYTLRVSRWDGTGEQKVVATAEGIATGTVDVEIRTRD